jgi:hypothetical protein
MAQSRRVEEAAGEGQGGVQGMWGWGVCATGVRRRGGSWEHATILRAQRTREGEQWQAD